MRDIAIAAIACLLPLAACCMSGSRGGMHSHAPSGPAVATFGDVSISKDEFEKRLKEQSPFYRSRYTAMDKKKEFLDGMIRFELLADEARREGFDQDPEVVRTVEKALVQSLIHKKFGDEGADRVTDAELHAAYDAHKDEYLKPERIRLQVIAFGSKKLGAEAAAKKALADLKAAAAKNDFAKFGTLATALSDDEATKHRNGDADFKTHDELAAAYGDAVAAAADQLKQVNEMSGLVTGKDGFYLLRLMTRQAALNRSFESVSAGLRSRVWHEKQNQAFETFSKKLRDDAQVTINEAELAKVDATVPNLGGPGAAPSPLMGGLQMPPVAATPPAAGEWRPNSKPLAAPAPAAKK